MLLWLLQNAFVWFVQQKVLKAHMEVERKFSISAEEAQMLPGRLQERSFKSAGTVIMTDTFLPPRRKGEMLRIRDEVTSDSARSVFTLKGWVHTADGGKERRESEAEVSSFTRTLAIVLGRFAGGKQLLSFSKERAHFEGKLDNRDFVACVDRVSGIGKYSGYYLEIESIVQMGEDPEQTRKEIFNFVENLFGTPRDNVKHSYMEMLELSRQ